MLIKGLNIYRDEAVEFQRRRLAGEVNLQLGASYATLTLVFIVSAIIFILGLNYWKESTQYKQSCSLITGSKEELLTSIPPFIKTNTVNAIKITYVTSKGVNKDIIINHPRLHNNKFIYKLNDKTVSKKVITSCKETAFYHVNPGRMALRQLINRI